MSGFTKICLAAALALVVALPAKALTISASGTFSSLFSVGGYAQLLTSGSYNLTIHSQGLFQDIDFFQCTDTDVEQYQVDGSLDYGVTYDGQSDVWLSPPAPTHDYWVKFDVAATPAPATFYYPNGTISQTQTSEVDYQILSINAAGPGALGDASLTISSVPEPSSWALMVIGMGMFGGVLRFKRGVRLPA